MIINITKENQLIIITLAEYEAPVIFDCKTHVLTSFTKRKRKTMPKECYVTDNHAFRSIVEDIAYIIEDNSASHEQSLRVKETFIPYLDKVEFFPKECPKGYIKFVLDNDWKFSEATMLTFKILQKAKNFSEQHKKNLFILHKLSNHNKSILLNYTDKEFLLFVKILNTTVKNFCWNFEHDVSHFLYETTRNFKLLELKWTELADCNRTFGQNIERIEAANQEDLSKRIFVHENLILPIEKLSKDNLIVVVPKKLSDFTIEGKQQNNCVGSYYHTNMAIGLDLIYFIRFTKDPSRSYVTCRYNVHDKKTVESRIKNNAPLATYTAAYQLIHEIDQKITEILNEQTKLKREKLLEQIINE